VNSSFEHPVRKAVEATSKPNEARRIMSQE